MATTPRCRSALEFEAAAHGATPSVEIGTVHVHTDNVVGGDRILAAVHRWYAVRRASVRAVTVGTV